LHLLQVIFPVITQGITELGGKPPAEDLNFAQGLLQVMGSQEGELC